MEDVKALIKDVLERGYMLSLATVNEAGPWVSDVNYTYDDGLNLYWLSQTSVRHSQALLANSHVAGTITLCNKLGEDKIGVQFHGHAEAVDEPSLEVAKRYAVKHGKKEPATAKEIMKPGQSWYCLKPIKYDLVHQPLFDHEKKFLEI